MIGIDTNVLVRFDAAAEARLTVARLDEAFLRMEYGKEVTGIFAVLTRDGV